MSAPQAIIKAETKMNQREQQMIADLAERIRSAPAPHIDPDAEHLIRSTIGARPDAVYILTQAVLLQDMALNQANARFRNWSRGAGAGFCQDRPAGRLCPSELSQSGTRNPPTASRQCATVYVTAAQRFFQFSAQCGYDAAGVLAGEIAFQSLGSLFSGGRAGSSARRIVPGSETIVNNYYGDQQAQGLDDGIGIAVCAGRGRP